MKKFILFSLGFLIINSFSIKAHEKEKVNLSAGFGWTELFNAGIRIQSNQTQFALSVGSLSSEAISVSGDVFFHFAGVSDFSERRPWYFRTGITHIHFKKTGVFGKILHFVNQDTNIISLNTRIGRDFNISKKVGINTDFGFALDLDFFTIEPIFSFSIFYRL
jgi:hypothetical protein